MARSTARKRALNTLYEADEKGQEILSLLAERIDHPGAQTPLPEYAIEIIQGVQEHQRTIDFALNEYSPSWKVRRMAVVDRNILRIAVWEMRYNDEVPEKVAIDEAISLSKTLSDAESPSFIHGLLSAVNDHRDEIAEVVAPVQEEPDVSVEDSDAASSIGSESGDVASSDDDVDLQPQDIATPSQADVSEGDNASAQRDELNSETDAELKSERVTVHDEDSQEESDKAENLETTSDSVQDITVESEHSQG
ncbi:transcription antitermination factor NusB [Bifidobacterium sp.]|jgi:N utilization substance protein B|uniref:transcription antitermination factor NusB n=1 Tax=Bifidobacterium sp. TaxID=41200 RepID=UPI0025C5D05A|nr:transcription antitermination factor NusB [Bifidobacterium sp.]MCI1635523.1 transcription antitermination factor NusB [Bifidobacterium sp.]